MMHYIDFDHSKLWRFTKVHLNIFDFKIFVDLKNMRSCVSHGEETVHHDSVIATFSGTWIWCPSHDFI